MECCLTEQTRGSRYGINPRHEDVERLDFPEIFGNGNPVALEIGSGKGKFLIDSGRQRPEMNFAGIEKSLHYYRVILDRLERARLENVRIINFDAFFVLRDMLSTASIRELHIYFPDPWPRPRERKRRLIRDEIVEQMARVLQPEGEGVYVTDHREYFEKAVPVLERFFLTESGEVAEGEPRTNYEAKYRAAGRPIFQARFRHR
jgi:tRNA (guanine-N7-)-methyltransferase